MVVRKVEKFEPVTLGNIRSHGCRDLLIYCGSINCNHSATMNADHLPENTVIRVLGPKMVRTKCGHVGAETGAPRAQKATFCMCITSRA